MGRARTVSFGQYRVQNPTDSDLRLTGVRFGNLEGLVFVDAWLLPMSYDAMGTNRGFPPRRVARNFVGTSWREAVTYTEIALATRQNYNFVVHFDRARGKDGSFDTLTVEYDVDGTTYEAISVLRTLFLRGNSRCLE